MEGYEDVYGTSQVSCIIHNYPVGVLSATMVLSVDTRPHSQPASYIQGT